MLRGAPSSLTASQSCLNDELLIVHVAQALVMGEPLGFGDKLRHDPLLFRNLTARLIFKRPSNSQTSRLAFVHCRSKSISLQRRGTLKKQSFHLRLARPMGPSLSDWGDHDAAAWGGGDVLR